MINRLEVKSKIPDTRARVLKTHLHSLGFRSQIKHLWLVDVYTIDKKLKQSDLAKITSMLANPVTQQASINRPQTLNNFTWVIEIGFLPGVTDNIATTTKESIEDLLKLKFSPPEGIYTSQLIFLRGRLSKKTVTSLANSLINPLIQRVNLKNAAQFRKDKGMDTIIPQVKLRQRVKVNTVNLNVSDNELTIIGKQGIANPDGTRRGPLALDLIYMKTIQRYFQKKNRQPTDIELESIAQTWSEHCKHTIFADPIDDLKAGLFKTFIKGATKKIRKKKGKKDICISVFTDNSGAIVFDKDWLITDKVETHNSPSALDPFGGSITGIVGVNRDTIGFGLGAKPIINRYGFCFADPQDKSLLYKGKNFTQPMLSPRRIMEGVIKGVNSGGNCSGIPTPQGFVIFNQCYQGKPLVFVGTVGLIPRKKGNRLLHQKRARSGDYIVMIGGRVGRDGIHGATFSSEAMDTGSPATAVQIGDPITQKKLSDAVVKEARDLGLYHSITDNGAGGLSCSVAEMAKECGGCQVELEKVPLNGSLANLDF
jgi:phosphoribosylformylglycinamidine (FGAM) synthase PurS component